MTSRTVYTLDARGNIMLEVMREYFSLSPEVMHRQIQGLVELVEEVLASKGIDYGKLKTALVPQTKKREAAFIFDRTVIPDAWYGLPIHRRLLPLFAKESNHSVLVGDYIGENQEQLYKAFVESVEPARDVEWKHSNQFYVVYINNLTDRMVENFRNGLKGFPPYAGLADMTYSSRLKTFLSFILGQSYLKHRRTILMGHEDDVANDRDYNMAGYPFEEFGYTCRSLQMSLYDVLLSYKIERPVFRGFEVDTELSFNAIHARPEDLYQLEIRIDEAKFGYLTSKKEAILKRTGLLNRGAKGLRELISAKLSSNYIYNMTYDEEHDTTKFDILLEVYPQDSASAFRVLAALKYLPDKSLSLITLH